MATYKEQLSKHVEGIFKGYTEPGLHVCDIATGGGKVVYNRQADL